MSSAETPSSDFTLYSDGGSDGGSSAAGACIVEDNSSGQRWHISVVLGPGTNNEAEIAGSLMGFAFLLSLGGNAGKRKVHWVADSEYVLKSAKSYIHNWQRNGWKTADKKPVKNQGLWRTYLMLSSQFNISTEHVRGHTGHPENEACDEAVQWVKVRGADLFEARSVLEVTEIQTTTGDADWAILDGTKWMAQLRRDEPEEEVMLWPVEVLKQLDQKVSETSERPRKAVDPEQSVLQPILKKINDALAAAEKAGAKSPKARTLAKSLRALLEDRE